MPKKMIHSMYSEHLRRRQRQSLTLEYARLRVEKMSEQVGDYDIVIVWGKHA